MTETIAARKIHEFELQGFAKTTQFILIHREGSQILDFSKIGTAELEAELARRQTPSETWVEFHIRMVNEELARRELGFEDIAKMTSPPMQTYHVKQILRSEKVCRMDIFERLIEALGLHPYRGESDDS